MKQNQEYLDAINILKGVAYSQLMVPNSPYIVAGGLTDGLMSVK